MIESIELFNFQAFKHLLVEFAPDVTTIVGQNDIGKSTIIRALRWVCLNQPGGTAMLRHGTKRCKVRLKVDGHTIVRERSKRNVYILDGRVLKAFGTGVPDEVAKVLQVSERHFSMQHDGAFWFSLPKAHVAKALAEVIDLSVIDNVLTYCRREELRASRAVGMQEALLQQHREQVKQHAWAREAHRALEKVERVAQEWDENRARAAQLGSLLGDLAETSRTLTEARTSLLRTSNELQEWESVAQTAEDAADAEGRAESLAILMTQLAEAYAASAELTVELAEAEGELEQAMEGSCPLCGQ